MQIQVRITNNTDKEIFLRWIGELGTEIPAKSNKIVDVSYLPGYKDCHRYHKENMESCLKDKVVSMSLISDLPVEAVKELETSLSVEVEQVKVPVKEEARIDDGLKVNKVFSQGPMETFVQKTISLDKVEAPKPVEVRLFEDAQKVQPAADNAHVFTKIADPVKAVAVSEAANTTIFVETNSKEEQVSRRGRKNKVG